MSFIEIRVGDSPIVLGLPHTGTEVPANIETKLNPEGRKLRDTDWHVHKLYDGLLAGVTTVRTRVHRYVIDCNRDPSGGSLYPGKNTTGLIPLTDFDDQPIWEAGAEPDVAETQRRVDIYHRPYHAALLAQMERVRAIHGVAILYDCHSIRSRCPFLFEGTLPDFNIGTNQGTSCHPFVEAAVVQTCREAEGYTHILNGRFKGGWTTRHFGRPQEGFHAIQMELAQATHLVGESLPFDYDAAAAERLRAHLGAILHRLEALAGSLPSCMTWRKP